MGHPQAEGLDGDAGAADAGARLETERAQPIRHDARGALLAEGQLRMAVQVAAHLDEVALEGTRAVEQ